MRHGALPFPSPIWPGEEPVLQTVQLRLDPTPVPSPLAWNFKVVYFSSCIWIPGIFKGVCYSKTAITCSPSLQIKQVHNPSLAKLVSCSSWEHPILVARLSSCLWGSPNAPVFRAVTLPAVVAHSKASHFLTMLGKPILAVRV